MEPGRHKADNGDNKTAQKKSQTSIKNVIVVGEQMGELEMLKKDKCGLKQATMLGFLVYVTKRDIVFINNCC